MPASRDFRLFVKIGQGLNEGDLRGHFSQWGEVTDVFIPRQGAAPGQHKGIGFVTYSSAAEMDGALQSEHEIKGHYVTVDPAYTKEDHQSGYYPARRPEPYQRADRGMADPSLALAPYGSAPAGYREGHGYGPNIPGVDAPMCDYSPYASPFANPYLHSPSPQQLQQYMMFLQQYGNGAMPFTPPQQAYGPPHGAAHGQVVARIFITKIPLDLTKEDLRTYFSQFGEIEDLFVPLADPTTGSPAHKGIAFLQFKNFQVAEEVLMHQCFEVRVGKTVVVDRALGRPDGKGKGKGRV